jgi:hypothetical protein
VLDAQAPGRPLPALRAEVSSLLDQAAVQVANLRQALPSADPRQPLPSANPWGLLPEILRQAFASLTPLLVLD